MLSALKKLVGSEPPVQPKDKNIPAGLQSMNQSMQRRFAKGVQYNSEFQNILHKYNLSVLQKHHIYFTPFLSCNGIFFLLLFGDSGLFVRLI